MQLREGNKPVLLNPRFFLSSKVFLCPGMPSRASSIGHLILSNCLGPLHVRQGYWIRISALQTHILPPVGHLKFYMGWGVGTEASKGRLFPHI